MSRASFIRSFLARGTAGVAITLLLFVGVGCPDNESTESNASQPVATTQLTTTATKPDIKTTGTQSAITTTTTRTTTTTTTTTESTTTTETTTEVTTVEVIPATEVVTDSVEVQPVIEHTLPISEQDRILIGNVISHEAGSAWISEYERVCIAAAIMNRVADSRFPNTVDGVLHQSGQFFDVPYYRVDYSGIGFEPIDRAIDAYFNGEYNCGNINSWSGDGLHNYFYHQ